MNYLLTDTHGYDWNRRYWTEGIHHQEENPNHFHLTYPNPYVALFLNPVHDNYVAPRLWEVAGVADTPTHDLRTAWSELAAIKEVGLALPTTEQYITFGILCSFHVVTHSTFVTWALNWLSGLDRSQTTAQIVAEELLNMILLEDDVSGGHAAVAAVAENNPVYFSACAAHRAYYTDPSLDLSQLALLAMTLAPEELAEALC